MARHSRQLASASLLTFWLLCLCRRTWAAVSAPEAAFDCSVSPRSGPTLFGSASDNASLHHRALHGKANHTFLIMQCGTKAPSLSMDLDALRSGWWKVPFQDQSSVINAAYAALHGYRYEFYEVAQEARRDTWWMRAFGGGSDIHPAWCRCARVGSQAQGGCRKNDNDNALTIS
ncbi:MAG: hypothetical protein WDW36_007533 [Sanguina aurantia]